MTFKKGNIPSNKGRKNPRPTKVELEQLYVKEMIGYSAIGKMFHITPADIRDLLVNYGFEIQGTARKGRRPWNKDTKGLMPTPQNKGKKMQDWVIEKMKQGNVGRPSNRKGATLKESTKELIREKRQHQKNVRESKHEKILKRLLDNADIKYDAHKGILRAQPDIFIKPKHTISKLTFFVFSTIRCHFFGGRMRIFLSIFFSL